MKKNLFLITLSLLMMVSFQSCFKDVMQSEKIKEITIDTTISAGSHYHLNLAAYGKDDDVATILEKGNHFAISQLENVDELFTSIYHYSSTSKTIGTDHVVISISQNPEGRRMCSKDSTIIYINFTIK